MFSEPFAAMLKGGHPNSLGRTVEVVELILADQTRLLEFYECYFDADEVVRLRVSNGMKRICHAQPTWLIPYIDRFLQDISQIQQASTQWTLAQLFLELATYLTPTQKTAATQHMQHNLTTWTDWIVLAQTMQTLAAWAQKDDELKAWLLPQLQHHAQDSRKAVAKKAQTLWDEFTKPPKRKKS